MLTIRIIAFFAAIIAFGIMLYIMYGNSKDAMDDAANIPLMDDDTNDNSH
jgi:hypothetical protein